MSEFKSFMQGDKEDLREFSRRVRSMGDVAKANKGVQTRDELNDQQFISGLYDAELHELLLREELESFTRTVARAQFLELANKTTRARSRRRTKYDLELQSIPDRII